MSFFLSLPGRVKAWAELLFDPWPSMAMWSMIMKMVVGDGIYGGLPRMGNIFEDIPSSDKYVKMTIRTYMLKHPRK